jgi:ribosome-binding protein aMBF1 (putative translation factor)
MDEATSQRADQALGQYVRGGRTLVDIGIELAYLRQQRGLSQRDLAQRARLVLGTVRAIESGTRLPTRREFMLLAAGLELTADRLAKAVRPVVEHQASGIRSWSGARDTTCGGQRRPGPPT